MKQHRFPDQHIPSDRQRPLEEGGSWSELGVLDGVPGPPPRRAHHDKEWDPTDDLRVPFWIVLAGVGVGAFWMMMGVLVGAKLMKQTRVRTARGR